MQKKIKLLVIAILTLCSSLNSLAENPIVPYVGMADPHIRIFNNKAYLYTTRDADSTAHSFVMPDWHIWSSDDLVNWKHETTILPTETYMGESNDCWATDAVSKNGKYYFYFSNRNINTGVMVGNSPIGPFKDALGKPMIDVNLTTSKEYDPTILIDNDENRTAYIAFGHHRTNDPELNWYIAKLNEDMITLAETPKAIGIIGEANVLTGNDKPTLHKRNGIFYLSAGSHYATATNIYGPYTKRGNSGNDDYGLTSRAHGNYFEWNNQWFHTWCHFHLGKDVARYRESYLTYLHYKDNGEMVSDTLFLQAHFKTGVGQYDATWDKIEAEWYMSANNLKKRENTTGGFEISEIQKGATLYFPNVSNLDEVKSISFLISAENSGKIRIYADKEKYKLLGTCKIFGNKSQSAYTEFKCKLKNTKDAKNILIEFTGNDLQSYKLDYFHFN